MRDAGAARPRESRAFPPVPGAVAPRGGGESDTDYRRGVAGVDDDAIAGERLLSNLPSGRRSLGGVDGEPRPPVAFDSALNLQQIVSRTVGARARGELRVEQEESMLLRSDVWRGRARPGPPQTHVTMPCCCCGDVWRSGAVASVACNKPSAQSGADGKSTATCTLM